MTIKRKGETAGERAINCCCAKAATTMQCIALVRNDRVGVGSTAGPKIDPFLISQISKEIIFMTIFAFVADG